MKNILTKTGYEQLKKKLTKLREKRIKMVKEMELARQEGDLAENSAYHQLRETVTIISQQIQDLEEKLANVKIVKSNDDGTVAVGSRVLIEINGQRRELEIVGDGEADPLGGKISYQSPIGGQLLGRKQGEVVKIKTPAGIVEYRILAVK